jgi:hypothetical protein
MGRLVGLIFLLAAATGSAEGAGGIPKARNVLFIAVDDMRPSIGVRCRSVVRFLCEEQHQQQSKLQCQQLQRWFASPRFLS